MAEFEWPSDCDDANNNNVKLTSLSGKKKKENLLIV
jgi:hypothetical protein